MSGQILQFPIRAGVDEGGDPKVLPPGTLREGVNVRWSKEGLLAKRHGTTPLGVAYAATSNASGYGLPAGNIGAASRFVTRGDELSVISNGRIYSRSAPLATWLNRAPVPDVGLTWETVLCDGALGCRSSDAVLFQGVIVHAWVEGDPLSDDHSNNAFCQLRDATTGALINGPVAISFSAAKMVRVVVVGSDCFVVFQSDTAIYAKHIGSTLSLDTEAQAILYEEGQVPIEASGFDAAAMGSRLVVAYHATTEGVGEGNPDTEDLFLTSFTHSAGVLTEDTTVEVDSDDAAEYPCISISIVDGERIWVAYALSDLADAQILLRFACHSTTASTLAQTLAPTTIVTGITVAQLSIDRHSSTQALVSWTRYADGDLQYAYTSSLLVTSAGAMTSTSFRTSWDVQLVSRPCLVDGRWLAIVAEDTNSFYDAVPSISSYLIEIETSELDIEISFPLTLNGSFVMHGHCTPHRMLGKIDHDIAATTVRGSLCSIQALVTDREYFTSVPFQASAAGVVDNLRCGTRLLRVLYGNSRPADFWRPVEIGSETYLPTGMLAAWDGKTMFDCGFRQVALQSVTSTANGSTMTNGTYTYQVHASCRSAAGVYHRGPPSDAKSETISANRSISLRLARHSLDCKQTTVTGFGYHVSVQVLQEVYRTVVDGSVPHKLTYEPGYNVVVNDPVLSSRVGAATFVDTRTDADITGGAGNDALLSARPVIYTESELEDVQPPAPRLLHFHNGRLWLVDGSGREAWFSKDVSENPGVAPGFHPTMRVVFEDIVTALGSLDDKLVVWAEDKFWIIMGDGPNVLGEDNRFSPPRAMQTDVGCINPKSVVGGHLGVYFQSSRGLFMLTRGLELVWVGEPVRDTLDAFPNITSAVLVPEHNEVRWTCNDAAGTDGRVIVHDYLRDAWLVRDYNTAFADAVVHDGAWKFVTPAGVVHVEDETTGLDNGVYVESRAKFASISPSGPLSWHRIKRVQVLGESVSNHRLTVNLYRDHATSVMQTATWPAGGDVTTIGPLEKAQLGCKYQKVQAITVEVLDAAPSNTTTHPLTTGRGFMLSAIGLEVRGKEGLAKASSGRRA